MASVASGEIPGGHLLTMNDHVRLVSCGKNPKRCGMLDGVNCKGKSESERLKV